MPRANRYFLPGHAWHLTHRCHKREFLLKFARDRRRWCDWLYEATKRYGLCVLNYIVTSNHIHLLVLAHAEDEIAKSMQLIAGRTAQEYNQRKHRQGAFWEDRYHATAVQTDTHLARCIAYIDMNMVRAGVVEHPAQWSESGYRAIQVPPKRYRIIDVPMLLELLYLGSLEALQQARRAWVEALMAKPSRGRDLGWSESIAVGDEAFVEGVKAELGLSASARKAIAHDDVYVLREPAASYTPYSGG